MESTNGIPYASNRADQFLNFNFHFVVGQWAKKPFQYFFLGIR